MVVVEGSSRHSQRRCEIVQLVETGVAHQMAPAAFTEPPVRTVDVQSQRRRSGRTRTGTGFGRAPRIRTPAPIPTAVATMVTIQDATISTYSLTGRRARRCTISARNHIRCHNLRHCAGPERAPMTFRPRPPPRRTPTRVAPHRRVRPGRWLVRWRPTWCDAPRRSHRRSCSGTRRAACGQCRSPNFWRLRSTRVSG